jgi:hypothetical protein
MAEFRMTQEAWDFFAERKVFFSKAADNQNTYKLGDVMHYYSDIAIEPFCCPFNAKHLYSMGAFSYSHSLLPIGTRVGRYCSIAGQVDSMPLNHPISSITTSSEN